MRRCRVGTHRAKLQHQLQMNLTFTDDTRHKLYTRLHVSCIQQWRTEYVSVLTHFTPLRLNFCSLVSVNNLPKSTTPHLIPLTLLKTLASTNTSQIRSDLSPNLDITNTIYVSFSVSIHTSIPKQPPPDVHCSLQA